MTLQTSKRGNSNWHRRPWRSATCSWRSSYRRSWRSRVQGSSSSSGRVRRLAPLLPAAQSRLAMPWPPRRAPTAAAMPRGRTPQSRQGVVALLVRFSLRSSKSWGPCAAADPRRQQQHCRRDAASFICISIPYNTALMPNNPSLCCSSLQALLVEELQLSDGFTFTVRPAAPLQLTQAQVRQRLTFNIGLRACGKPSLRPLTAWSMP